MTLDDFVVGSSPKWLDLKPPKRHTGDDGSPGKRGQLCLSMWLGPRTAEQPSGALSAAMSRSCPVSLWQLIQGGNYCSLGLCSYMEAQVELFLADCKLGPM